MTARLVARIWAQIAALLAIAILPVSLLQLRLQREAVGVVFNAADKAGALTALDGYMDFLKQSAQTSPERMTELKARFRKVQGTRQALEEFFLARDSLTDEIQRQTVINTLWALGLSLIASAVVARLIVAKFRQLHLAHERSTAKLRDFNALESWQTVARSLVHELRAPITPIKLVATDLEPKLATLPPDQFKAYLGQAQSLVLEQVQAIEVMIESFTAFGKLPKANPAPTDCLALLSDFIGTYGRAFGERVALRLASGTASAAPVALDPKLTRDLLFNLCKNSAEANRDSSTEITLGFESRGSTAAITVHNTGKTIPPSLAPRIFDLFVSGNDPGGNNSGLGLAIARKIALDHGGDLELAQNDAGGVAFRFEFPAGNEPGSRPNPRLSL